MLDLAERRRARRVAEAEQMTEQEEVRTLQQLFQRGGRGRPISRESRHAADTLAEHAIERARRRRREQMPHAIEIQRLGGTPARELADGAPGDAVEPRGRAEGRGMTEGRHGLAGGDETVPLERARIGDRVGPFSGHCIGARECRGGFEDHRRRLALRSLAIASGHAERDARRRIAHDAIERVQCGQRAVGRRRRSEHGAQGVGQDRILAPGRRDMTLRQADHAHGGERQTDRAAQRADVHGRITEAAGAKAQAEQCLLDEPKRVVAAERAARAVAGRRREGAVEQIMDARAGPRLEQPHGEKIAQRRPEIAERPSVQYEPGDVDQRGEGGTRRT